MTNSENVIHEKFTLAAVQSKWQVFDSRRAEQETNKWLRQNGLITGLNVSVHVTLHMYTFACVLLKQLNNPKGNQTGFASQFLLTLWKLLTEKNYRAGVLLVFPVKLQGDFNGDQMKECQYISCSPSTRISSAPATRTAETLESSLEVSTLVLPWCASIKTNLIQGKIVSCIYRVRSVLEWAILSSPQTTLIVCVIFIISEEH